MAENVDRIFVMANPRGRQETPQGVFTPLSPGQVALIEEHPDHPADPVTGVHRVFIVQGDPPCEAAVTTAVSEKLVQNQLVSMSRTDAMAIYKQKTGRDYPGTEPVEEPEPQQEPVPFTLEEAEGIDTRTPAQKRADTIAAKKAAEDEAAAESESSESDDFEGPDDSDLTSDEED